MPLAMYHKNKSRACLFLIRSFSLFFIFLLPPLLATAIYLNYLSGEIEIVPEKTVVNQKIDEVKNDINKKLDTLKRSGEFSRFSPGVIRYEVSEIHNFKGRIYALTESLIPTSTGGFINIGCSKGDMYLVGNQNNIVFPSVNSSELESNLFAIVDCINSVGSSTNPAVLSVPSGGQLYVPIDPIINIDSQKILFKLAYAPNKSSFWMLFLLSIPVWMGFVLLLKNSWKFFYDSE